MISIFSSRKNDRAASETPRTEALLLLQAFEESCNGWLWSTDATGNLTYLSDSMCTVLGGGPGEFDGYNFARLFVHAEEDKKGRRTLPFLLARHAPFERLIVRAAVADGGRCWTVSGRPHFDPRGQFLGFRGSAVDVTEHQASSRHASQLAEYDALTGLPNRRRMSEVLETTLRTRRQQNRSCAIMLIDLDRFKQVNDTLGHPAGDQLLKQVSERLVTVVGDKERVFRLGGDEFQIIVPNSDNRGIVGDLATDVIRALSQPYLIEGSRCVIGASIGIAVSPLDGENKDELIRNADLALYASKEGGRGRYRFFATELLEEAEDRRALEEDLREALARGEMRVAYQPIVNTRTSRMTGVEALVRWTHETRGDVSPALFIPIAEEAGLIPQIGEWVLRQACEDAAGWPAELRVAVNVSPIQFANAAFPATVMNALARSGLPAGQLELEITEGVFLSQSTDTDTLFATLKEIGVRLALDDFGTGYSSLGYLQSAPFDKIKIDQSFVRAATVPGSRNGAIISAIVALAEALDMETTAEGVEYMDQLRLVRNLRVSHAQGWVFSKAVSSEEVARRLAEDQWTIDPSGPARQRSERQSMYRQVGVIHGVQYDKAIIRNLSDTGALIDGVAGLKPDELIVVDFGDGQLTVAHVIRSSGKQHGLAFEQPLIDDGGGGLCTSHRVSPLTLGSLGLPTETKPIVEHDGTSPTPLEKLANRLGLTLAPRRAAPEMGARSLASSHCAQGRADAPNLQDLSSQYLQSLEGDEQSRERAKRDLRNHILPRFGQLRLDEVSEGDLFAWLAAKVEIEAHPAGTDERLHALLTQIWEFAVNLGLPGAETNPLAGRSWGEWRAAREDVLAAENALKLLEVAQTSSNRQLKYIIALMMTTNMRQGELLKAEWAHIDLEARHWALPEFETGKPRQVRLDESALAILVALPRWEGCSYLLPNPVTKQVYRSIQGSWDAVKVKAGLPHVELDDLRYCAADGAKILERLGLAESQSAVAAKPEPALLAPPEAGIEEGETASA